jgi:hypothetical protein
VAAVKPFLAWAILTVDGTQPTPALVDYRLPVFWMKSVAKQFNKDHLGNSGRIVRVVLTESER